MMRIDRARHYRMSEAERDERRIGFAYGNARLHDPRITRALVRRVAEEMSR